MKENKIERNGEKKNCRKNVEIHRRHEWKFKLEKIWPALIWTMDTTQRTYANTHTHIHFLLLLWKEPANGKLSYWLLRYLISNFFCGNFLGKYLCGQVCACVCMCVVWKVCIVHTRIKNSFKPHKYSLVCCSSSDNRHGLVPKKNCEKDRENERRKRRRRKSY